LPRWNRFVRPQDFVWLLFFSAFPAVDPNRSPELIEVLVALGLFQVIQPRIPALNTQRGNIVSIFIKLVLGFLLIGVSGGVTSSYYPILLLPVISAATTLGLLGTLIITALACGFYVSFAHPLFLGHFEITTEGVRLLTLRVMFLPVVAFLTNQLAEANRVEARKYQATAADLAAANARLREAQASVRRTERLAALGQLTAGLAHELRNPLGTMKASAEMLSRNVAGENEVARELAGFISTEVDRINSLVTRFLEFARPMRLRREKTDLTQIIDRAVGQLERHQPPLNVAIYKNYSPDIRPFPLDGELIERVVYNLLLNAAQATPPGGCVTIKTRLLDNDDAEIAVIDRGAGIDPKHRESIFNPFFTTKSEGIGMGLALVSKIVDEHGGVILVESDPGKGSVFRVDLPTEAVETTA
jgi:two-component system, NtrC family, sensor histidine kinase HydH